METLLDIHPNDAALVDFIVPNQWLLDWWNNPPHWHSLLNSRRPSTIIDDVSLIPLSSHAMSPKKFHQVTTTTHFIHKLVITNNIPSNFRIVDVGAGQGYLTRALHTHFNVPTLALDAQSHRRPPFPGITYKSVHIDPDSLVQAIDQWIPHLSTPIPILLVALHACGSLTPDIFRAAFSLPATHPWYPIAIVAVGCCYNLMNIPRDFPLSHTYLQKFSLPFHLPPSAFHLAAQIPDHWSDSPKSLDAASLAIRKVVWRAILGRIFAQLPFRPDTMPKLGKLPNAAYTSWPLFLSHASSRIGIDFDIATHPPPDPLLVARLENLHVRRCLLGPFIEKTIIHDRVAWIQETLSRTATAEKDSPGSWSKGYTIEAVNLFDQTAGSPRNVALVMTPPAPEMDSG